MENDKATIWNLKRVWLQRVRQKGLHDAAKAHKKAIILKWLLLILVVSWQSPSPANAQVGPTANFDWEMEERTFTTTDASGDPVLQHPILNINGTVNSGSALLSGVGFNTVYSNPPIETSISPETFSVTFKSVSDGSAITRYAWIIQQLNNGPLVFTASVPKFFIPLARGAYDVTLTVTDQNGRTGSIKRTVTVRDILVVSMGDSFSSGEGNPNTPQIWDGPLNVVLNDGPKWQDTIGLPLRTSRCHRSLHAWPVAFAVALEKNDPHTSVTLVHVACSGAQIEGPAGKSDGGNSGPERPQGGLLDDYWGVERAGSPTTLEPQVRQVLKKLCAENVSGGSFEVGECPQPATMRKIDALMMSIGVNDIRFSAIINDCVLSLDSLDVCENPDTFNTYNLGLQDRYARLNEKLLSVFPPATLKPASVYLLKYPDPTHNPAGEFCDGLPSSVFSPLGYPGRLFPLLVPSFDVLNDIDRSENGFLFNTALTSLNTSVRTITTNAGWNLVDRVPSGGDLVAEFSAHGFCAGPERWFRTGLESSVVQGQSGKVFDIEDQIGALPGSLGTTGVLHPNIDGHNLVKTAALNSYLAKKDSVHPDVNCSADTVWHATDVTLQCTASDGSEANASGLLHEADATTGFSLRTNVPANVETSNAIAGTYTVCDYDLNCIEATYPGNKVDKKPPSIEVLSPVQLLPPAGPDGVYILNQAVPASYTCADGGSGVASCAGSLPNGANIDTLAVGFKSFTVNAADNVQNTSNLTVQYAVTYKICPLYNQTMVYKAGSVIPVRLQLCDANGQNVSLSSVSLTAMNVTLISTTVSTEAADSGNANPDGGFRYDGGAYVYNLSSKGLGTGKYLLSFTAANDPIVHTTGFQLK
jgi:hypothetical protein